MTLLAPLHFYVAYGEHKLYVTTLQGDIAAGRTPAAGPALRLMRGIKERLDPRGTLNPGRFVGDI